MKKILLWDEYFMELARVSAMRSKDPHTQVGACIIDSEKHVVGLGYNGQPKGLDNKFSWDKNEKHYYVVHAELNAILNSIKNLDGCTIYCTLFPCAECAKAIAQSGIIKVIYLSDKDKDKEYNKAAKKIFTECGIEYEQM